MGLKYNAGLGLIATVVFIWVVSAEVTQRIFSEYKQPFALTYLGVSLMVVYLPIALLKDWICNLFNSNLYRNLYDGSSVIDTSIGLDELPQSAEADLKRCLITDKDLSEREEGQPLNSSTEKDGPDLPDHVGGTSSWETAKCSLYLTPIWFTTEYLSNSALANTSVASTTVLTSTSGLFTLFFGALLGQDSVNVANVVAVFISMTGVAMTTIGKTWASDEMLSVSEARRHSIMGNLALKVPVASKPARSVVHPSWSPCFCKIKLNNFPLQTAVVPYIPSENHFPDNQPPSIAATFHLSKADIDKLAAKSIFSAKLSLKIAVYTGRSGATCGVNSGRLLGRVLVPLDLTGTDSRACVFHNGWISVGKEGNKNSSAQFHLNVKAEPDRRFVFQFDGEPECSPQVFQIRGNIRQPVFTCKFSFRNTGDRNQRSRPLQSEPSSSRSWLSSFGSERERPGKERKGWSITVHDLSGSPVAAASMVTPFVASPGSDRVSRSNPGSWLILRPGDGTWKPWGRLEAWRERGSSDGLGYRFELIPDMSASAAIVLAESTLSSRKGGKFVIDLGSNSGGASNWRNTPVNATSPACSPRSSGDYGYGLWPFCLYRGFVMSARVEGEGKCSKPCVEVSVQHVNCTEDAAAYVALAAAVDLSMDACRLFSQRLRKELSNPHDILV